MTCRKVGSRSWNKHVQFTVLQSTCEEANALRVAFAQCCMLFSLMAALYCLLGFDVGVVSKVNLFHMHGYHIIFIMIIYVASKKETKNCTVQTFVNMLIYLMQMEKCPVASRVCCLLSIDLLYKLQRKELNQLE